MSYSYENIQGFIYSNDDIHKDSYFVELISNLIVEHKLVIELPTEVTLFRARPINNIEDEKCVNIVEGFYGYDVVNSGAPMNEQVKYEGRFNDKNEALYYVADDSYTAMAELRTAKGQRFSIATIEIKRSMQLIDLTVKQYDGQSIMHLITFYLSLPSLNFGYSFSRQLAKIVRSNGYDGIKYSSSLSVSGSNYVFFDCNCAFPVSSRMYQMKSILYYANEQLPRVHIANSLDLNVDLIPKSITDQFSSDEIMKFWKEYNNRKEVND